MTEKSIRAQQFYFVPTDSILSTPQGSRVQASVQSFHKDMFMLLHW
jgi:hypothetical protein